MSNPWIAPKSDVTDADLEQQCPGAYMSTTQADWTAVCKSWKTVPHIKEMLDGLDVGAANAFYIEKRYCILDSVRTATKPKMATAGTGAISARLRTGEALHFANAVFRELKEDEEWTEKLYTNGTYPLSRNAAAHKCRTVMQLGGGSEYTLGRLRKYYPRSDKWEGQRVPSASEVAAAMRRCGLVLTKDNMPQLSVLEEEVGRNSVTVNPNAENGYPILGKWKDDGAAAMALGLARAMDKDFARAYTKDKVNGVYLLVRRLEEERPWCITLKGKAKTDFYTQEKMEAASLRFYNVVNRPVQLLLQRVTQPYEQASGTIVDGFNSFHGSVLPHGGADEIVSELDRRLEKADWVHIHCGDDSWVVARDGKAIVCFSVDASSFDLTQAASITAPIHMALRHQMERIPGDAAARSAQLWYALARERCVVVAAGVVKRFKHGGPSGLPIQPKTNGVLMEIYLTRLQERVDLSPATRKGAMKDPERLDSIIKEVALTLGLTVRLEDYQRQEDCGTLRDFLAAQPFKFVGFLFHAKAALVEGTDRPLVDVCISLDRMLGQCRYPPYLWETQPSRRKMRESMRLGAMVLGMGIPPAGYERPFVAARQHAVELLTEALKIEAPREDIEASWSSYTSVYAPMEAMSLEGLRAALLKPASAIWRARTDVAELEVLGSEGSGEMGNWADEMDLAVPLASPVVPAKVALPAMPVLPRAHPATDKNAGRPPPTARWGPNKAPKPQSASASGGASTSAAPAKLKGKASRKGPKLKFAPLPEEEFYSLSGDEDDGGFEDFEETRRDSERLALDLEERMFR